jgi:hypothetical protein
MIYCPEEHTLYKPSLRHDAITYMYKFTVPYHQTKYTDRLEDEQKSWTMKRLSKVSEFMIESPLVV